MFFDQLHFRQQNIAISLSGCITVGHVQRPVPTDGVEICVNRFSLAICLALQVKTVAAIMANPRKFSEKIALHTQKQAEETAAFEQIMREVSDATSKVSN